MFTRQPVLSVWSCFDGFSADGRKFRSRNELRNYFAELKVPFPDESFDFMVGRKMEMIRSQTDGRRKPIENLITPPTKSSPAVKKSEKYENEFLLFNLNY